MKRFPTKDPEPHQPSTRPQQKQQQEQQQPSGPRPKRKGKPSVQFESPPTQNGDKSTAPSRSAEPKSDYPPTQLKREADQAREKKSTTPPQDSARKEKEPVVICPQKEKEPVVISPQKEKEPVVISPQKEKEPLDHAPPPFPDRAMPEKKTSGSDSGDQDFDLRPPPRSKPKSISLETLSQLLFSEGYLSTLTSEPQLLARFTAFLNKYKPDISHLVLRYLETQKVIKAIHYANAVAATLVDSNVEKKNNASPAAELSPSFLESSQDAFNTLLSTALPAWVTYSLVKTATSCLTAEITNRATPLTRDLVGGLSEVFCITDPTQEDNPIVYSSEEFYRLTSYDKDSVIGHNCRFLQGPKTKCESVQRLSKAIHGGEEICETLLNYRRDGRPFVNVLMLAPLHDDKGKVKYYLGAQVDASRLVEGGRGVDGFERFLVKREMDSERGRDAETDSKRTALAKLRDLSMTFDLEESAVVQSHSRSSSMIWGSREGSVASTDRVRRRFDDDDERSGSDDDDDDDDDKNNPAWKLSRDKPSGGLPGVYQKYLLIRPYPSLRIIFVSQAVRKMGQLQQRPFLAHVAAPSRTLTGLKESFQSGTPATAKIAIMARAGKTRDGTATGRWGKRGKGDNRGEDPAKLGKTCWISATPLLDGENRVGVWMVVIVDKFNVAPNTGRTIDAPFFSKEEEANFEAADRELESSLVGKTSRLEPGDLPIKPKPVGGMEIDEQLPNHDTDSRTPPNGVNEDILGPAREEEEENSQRSERALPQEGSGDEEYTDANNGPIESPNGSPVLETADEQREEQDQHHDQHHDQEQDGPGTPSCENPEPNGEVTLPHINHDDASDATPKQAGGGGSHSTRPVGLHAMDYLTSCSPVRKRQVNGIDEDEDTETDWNIASPYSVD